MAETTLQRDQAKAEPLPVELGRHLRRAQCRSGDLRSRALVRRTIRMPRGLWHVRKMKPRL